MTSARFAVTAPAGPMPLVGPVLDRVRGGDYKFCAICQSQICNSPCSVCIPQGMYGGSGRYQYVNFNDGYATGSDIAYWSYINRTFTACTSYYYNYYTDPYCAAFSFTGTGGNPADGWQSCALGGAFGNCSGVPNALVCP